MENPVEERAARPGLKWSLFQPGLTFTPMRHRRLGKVIHSVTESERSGRCSVSLCFLREVLSCYFDTAR